MIVAHGTWPLRYYVQPRFRVNSTLRHARGVVEHHREGQALFSKAHLGKRSERVYFLVGGSCMSQCWKKIVIYYPFLGWILDFLNSLPLFFCITATTSHQHSFCSAREGRARETHGRSTYTPISTVQYLHRTQLHLACGCLWLLLMEMPSCLQTASISTALSPI